VEAKFQKQLGCAIDVVEKILALENDGLAGAQPARDKAFAGKIQGLKLGQCQKQQPA
jgi:hypothetical protein